MPSTAKKRGKISIKTFTDALHTKSAALILDLLTIQDKESHQRAVTVAGLLMDMADDTAESDLDLLLDRLTDAIESYENQQFPFQKASGSDVLQALMEAHNIKQADLQDIFGSQGNVSQVLKGRRNLTVEHILKLSERFKVPASVFI